MPAASLSVSSPHTLSYITTHRLYAPVSLKSSFSLPQYLNLGNTHEMQNCRLPRRREGAAAVMEASGSSDEATQDKKQQKKIE
ncbi:hypothetical protein QL285_030479 [Trifolium repens]|nr:hypothetical protein QL285_030479 [Trifolium repens]